MGTRFCVCFALKRDGLDWWCEGKERIRVQKEGLGSHSTAESLFSIPCGSFQNPSSRFIHIYIYIYIFKSWMSIDLQAPFS